MRRMTMAGLVALVLGAGALGCESRQAGPDRVQQPQQAPATGGSGEAEAVNPHTTGGTGGAGQPTNTPPAEHSVGVGSDSKQQEPKLQDAPASGPQR